MLRNIILLLNMASVGGTEKKGGPTRPGLPYTTAGIPVREMKLHIQS